MACCMDSRSAKPPAAMNYRRAPGLPKRGGGGGWLGFFLFNGRLCLPVVPLSRLLLPPRVFYFRDVHSPTPPLETVGLSEFLLFL